MLLLLLFSYMLWVMILVLFLWPFVTHIFGNTAELLPPATTSRNGSASAMQEYIEVLYRILRPGGYWINLGPLLW